MSSGTHNVPGIAGLGEAAAQAYENMEEKIEHLHFLRERFLDGVSQVEGIRVNSILECSAPHIVNISVSGVRSEVLLHALEEWGVYVSAGSACSSNHHTVSGTLSAMHVEPELLESAVRFSFSSTTQEEEIDYAIQRLSELVPKLRRYTRR